MAAPAPAPSPVAPLSPDALSRASAAAVADVTAPPSPQSVEDAARLRADLASICLTLMLALRALWWSARRLARRKRALDLDAAIERMRAHADRAGGAMARFVSRRGRQPSDRLCTACAWIALGCDVLAAELIEEALRDRIADGATAPADGDVGATAPAAGDAGAKAPAGADAGAKRDGAAVTFGGLS